jgi:MFS transporter, DHA1 family, inner membrane transport protein
LTQIALSNKASLKSKLNFQVTIIVIIRTVFNTFYRMIYPFLSYFMVGLGVDLRTISYAFTTRSLMGVVGPFLASVADSRGRKAGILLGTITYTVAIGMIAIWPTYPVFFIGLSVAFIGYLIFVPSTQAYLGDRVPYEKRGRVLGITEFAWSLSAIIGIPIAGFIITRRGWLAPIPLIAILGVIGIGILSWMLPKDERSLESKPGFWKNLGKIMTYPPAVAALVMAGLYTAANEVVTLVYGVWLKQAFDFNVTSLFLATMVIGIAEFSGEILVTLFTDRIGKRRSVAIGLFGNCVASVALALFGRSLTGALICLVLFYITFEFTIVSGIPLMSEIMPAARATMLASHMAILAIGRAVGDLLAPALFSQSFIPGIAANALAAILFNLVALFALTRVRMQVS